VDIPNFLRVLGRFRVLVVCGLALAVLLAALSFLRVDFKDGVALKYRAKEEWVSYTRLLLTQPGFRWGDSNVGSSANPDAQAAIEGRLPQLATIYSSFVTSDRVRQIMLREGKIDGLVSASALPVSPGSTVVLPIVNIQAIGYSERSSIELANRAGRALRAYIDAQQRATRTKPQNRIRLAVLNAGYETKLLVPRKKTMPIVVLLTVVFATVALAFLLENIRPPAPTPTALERVEPPSERVA
jgi:hypothetical protein